MDNVRYGNRDLSYRFHKLSLLLERVVSASLLDGADLTFAQFKILMSLNHNAEATGAQIADYLGLTEAAVSRQVSQLVDHGYLKRELDTVHRRQHRLTVTARGRVVTDKTRRVLGESVEPVFAEIDEAVRQQLGETLDQLTRRARTVCEMNTKASPKAGGKAIGMPDPRALDRRSKPPSGGH